MESERAVNLTDRFSVIMQNISPYDDSAFIWFALWCPKKMPCRLATLNGVTHRLLLATFLITSKAFVSNMVMHKIMAS